MDGNLNNQYWTLVLNIFFPFYVFLLFCQIDNSCAYYIHIALVQVKT